MKENNLKILILVVFNVLPFLIWKYESDKILHLGKMLYLSYTFKISRMISIRLIDTHNTVKMPKNKIGFDPCRLNI